MTTLTIVINNIDKSKGLNLEIMLNSRGTNSKGFNEYLTPKLGGSPNRSTMSGGDGVKERVGSSTK